MDIRLAGPNDFEALRRLWAGCFDDSPAFVDWYFTNVYSAEGTLCLVEGGEILSSLQIIPRDIYVRGIFVPSGYIVGVCTRPDRRGRGLAARLLYEAAELMRRRGCPISLLVPFSFGFYRRFAWEVTHFLWQVEYAPTPERNLSPGSPLTEASEKDIDALSAAYTRFCSGKHGFFRRDRRHWRRLLDDLALDGGQAFLSWSRDGLCTGYLLGHRGGDSWNFREIVSLSPGARQDQNAFIEERAKTSALRLQAAPGFEVGILSTFPGVRVALGPFMMTRIEDFTALCDGLQMPDGVGCSFTLAISSAPHLPDSVYRCRVQNGRCHVEPEPNAKPDVSAPAGTWSQLVLGAVTPSQAALAGRLETDSPHVLQCLEALFTSEANYAIELF